MLLPINKKMQMQKQSLHGFLWEFCFNIFIINKFLKKIFENAL